MYPRLHEGGGQIELDVANRKLNEQLNSIIADNTGEALIVIQNRRIKFCSHRAVELSGYSESQLRRLSWLKLVHPDDRHMMLSECGGDSKRRVNAEPYTLRMQDREKNPKWLELHHKNIEWDGTEATLVFFRDITERKRLESQFLQAQKMEAVGRLAGGIAHDFNNFLTVILGYTELLEKQMSAPNADSTNVLAIREAATKASALTQKLLAFSRKQHLEPKTINPSGLLEGMRIASVADAFGASIAPHTGNSPVITAASVHLAACAPNGLIQETFEDYDHPTMRSELFDGFPTLRRGELPVPERAGLGIDFDESACRRYPPQPHRKRAVLVDDEWPRICWAEER